MPQTISTGFRALVEAAEREIETLPVETAIAQHGRDDITFVDLRDIRELEREGRIPSAFHCHARILDRPRKPLSQARFCRRQEIRVLLRRWLAFRAGCANGATHGPSSGRAHRRRIRRLARSRRAGRSTATENKVVKGSPKSAESTRVPGAQSPPHAPSALESRASRRRAPTRRARQRSPFSGRARSAGIAVKFG